MCLVLLYLWWKQSYCLFTQPQFISAVIGFHFPFHPFQLYLCLRDRIQIFQFMIVLYSIIGGFALFSYFLADLWCFWRFILSSVKIYFRGKNLQYMPTTPSTCETIETLCTNQINAAHGWIKCKYIFYIHFYRLLNFIEQIQHRNISITITTRFSTSLLLLYYVDCI